MAVDLHTCILEMELGWSPIEGFVLPPEVLAVQVEPARWIHPLKQFLLAAGKATSSYSGCFFFLIDVRIHCNLWLSVLVKRCWRFSKTTWIHFSEAPSVCLGEIFISQQCDTEAGKYQAPCFHLHNAQLRWWQATWKILCEPLIPFTPLRQALAVKWNLAGRGRQFSVFVYLFLEAQKDTCMLPWWQWYVHFTLGCSSCVEAVCQNRTAGMTRAPHSEGKGQESNSSSWHRKGRGFCPGLPHGTTNIGQMELIIHHQLLSFPLDFPEEAAPSLGDLFFYEMDCSVCAFTAWSISCSAPSPFHGSASGGWRNPHLAILLQKQISQ